MHFFIDFIIVLFCFLFNLPLAEQKGSSGGSIFLLCSETVLQNQVTHGEAVRGVGHLSKPPLAGDQWCFRHWHWARRNRGRWKARQQCSESKTSQPEHRLSVSSSQAFFKWRGALNVPRKSFKTHLLCVASGSLWGNIYNRKLDQAAENQLYFEGLWINGLWTDLSASCGNRP